MYANIQFDPIQIFQNYPRKFTTVLGNTLMNYPAGLSQEELYDHGWRDVLQESLTEHQKSGAPYLDQEQDLVIIPAVDMTTEEIEEYEAQKEADEIQRRKELRGELSRQGISVPFTYQGTVHNITMDKSELNDFIALKKVIEDAGGTEISWETDVMDVWVTMSMAEATGFAAQMAQGFLAIYQNN